MKIKGTLYFLLTIVIVLLNTCDEKERLNPWDLKNTLDPGDWAPQNVEYVINSETSVTISWDYTAILPEGFKIDRKEGDTNWHYEYAVLDNDERSFTDNSVNLYGNQYKYRVYAYAGNKTSAYADVESITLAFNKIFLEYYTGHHCPICPSASEMARTLKDHYGDRLVVMAIHAGWFARVTPDEFSYDFTTDEGEELYDFFGVLAIPTGIVNRTEYDGHTLLSPSAWAEAIEEFIDDAPQFHIEINMQHHENDNELEVSIDIKSFINSIGHYYISAFIIEDGIIKPQKTNDPDYPDGIIMDYEHNNVLRKGINGTWGDQLNNSPINTESMFTKNYRVNIDNEWLLENTSVVAFVYHFTTNKVMQAEIAAVSRYLK